MLTAIGNVEVYLAAEPIDLRKGFDGLSAVIRQAFGQEPMSGHLFVFINRRKDRIKVLYWDRSGYAIFYKRLERGTFRLPRRPRLGEPALKVEPAELQLLLEGIDLRDSKRRPRWSPRRVDAA